MKRIRDCAVCGLALVAALLAGCASPEPQPRIAPDGRKLAPNERVIRFVSDPPGMRVFHGGAVTKGSANATREFIGITPFEWVIKCRKDGTVDVPGALVYSLFVPSVVLFTAEPPAGSTNLFPQDQVFKGGTLATQRATVPEAIFFDMTKPPRMPGTNAAPAAAK